MNNKSHIPNELEKIVSSASRLGIELDEKDAKRWLSAVELAGKENDIEIDIKSGVFGHKISMLDFSDAELAQFRKIGKIVEFIDIPGEVETALALSGSAAQSKIQKYPGDADFFERVNIINRTKSGACNKLGEIIQKKVKTSHNGPTFQMIEVKMGSYPFDFVFEKENKKAGTPISWHPEEVIKGKKIGKNSQGEKVELIWEEIVENPGWCKLDWVFAHPVHKHLVNVSNMLDVTWENSEGKIIPLDGFLDPYFQEVYLQSESIPLFTKLAKEVSSDALDNYVQSLRKEIKKYLTKSVNYGKAAKRMYNIFRLTGRYQEAVYIRELFDEPATVLYQVWSLIRTIDDCCGSDSTITLEQLLAHTDELIVIVIKELEDEREPEIVRLLLRLRDALTNETAGKSLSPRTEAARAEVINIVNNFFYEKLTAIPEIKGYLDELSKA